MSQIFERSMRVEMLLNTLEAERYVRRALLENVIDELRGSGSDAVGEGRRLLAKLDGGANDTEFLTGLKSLRRAVLEASASASAAA